MSFGRSVFGYLRDIDCTYMYPGLMVLTRIL